MNDKKEKMILTATHLFAEKGFYATTIQEITDNSNVSKGAFYLHFQSKDQLLIEIFKYHYKQISEKIMNIAGKDLSPRQNFMNQLEVQLNEIWKHKNFIMTQLKEQTISFNKELLEFICFMEMETLKGYEYNLTALYGDTVRPFILDIEIMFEGIKNSYLQFFMQRHIAIPIKKLVPFLMKQLDNIAAGLLSDNSPPILLYDHAADWFGQIQHPEQQAKQQVMNDLLQIQEMLNHIHLDNAGISELQGSLDLLIAEVQKEDMKKIIVQGMLAHFNTIPEFDAYRKQIADKLEIRLL